MSWRASAYVKGLTVAPTGESLTRTEKLLLLVLADYYDDDRGEAWPSLRALERDSLMSRRWVITTLHRLSDKGVLVIREGGKGHGRNDTNGYHLPYIGGEPTSPRVVNPVAHGGELTSPPIDGGVVNSECTGVVNSVHQGGEVRVHQGGELASAPEPSLAVITEPSLNRQVGRTKRARRTYLPVDAEFIEQMRAKYESAFGADSFERRMRACLWWADEKNYKDRRSYLDDWLARDVEKERANGTNGASRNGVRESGTGAGHGPNPPASSAISRMAERGRHRYDDDATDPSAGHSANTSAPGSALAAAP